MEKKQDFLRKIVKDDLNTGKYTKIVTRFPPEPNGFPHIGHAKSIAINFGIAKDFNGVCNLRMDDTNPTTEDTAYVEALKDAVEWLGFKWDGEVRYTSDYFDKLYHYAIKLIKMGKAYVDSLNEDEIKEYRGTVTSPGKRSKYAYRSIEENLELFERMKNGEFGEGEHILRAKIDMNSPNMKMRDPLLYRIRHTAHFRAGKNYAVYPMYDFAHPLSDYIEGISHSFCTLEFENNRELYDWVIEALELKPPRPYQYEFARLNLNYTVMSKRKLKELVDKNIVNGWDDPRLPTIAGLRKRGYTPNSILNFCESIGVAKANSTVDVAQLEFAIRDDLNLKVPRVMCVMKPLKVTIANYDKDFEEIEASLYPSDVPKEGSRKLNFSKHIYINRDDFAQNPPKGYFRLTPNQPVRLKYAYIIECKEVITDANGEAIEIIAHYYPDSKSGQDKSGVKVKSAIQWVEKGSAKKAKVRIYDRLFKEEFPNGIEDINPDSLKIVKNALVEPFVLDSNEERFQFEREGYFFKDMVDFDTKNPVFNKIVSLKDSWGKKTKNTKPKTQNQKPKQIQNQQIEGEVTPMSEAELKLFERYTKELKLNKEMANTLARDEVLSNFFEISIKDCDDTQSIAKLVTNEVARELKEKDIKDLKFSPSDIADLAKLIDDETISSKIAKEVYDEMAKNGKNPKIIVDEKGLKQINNPDEILPIIKDIMTNNAQNVEKYKAGNTKLFGFFVGQVLKATSGKANPKIVNELVKKELG